MCRMLEQEYDRPHAHLRSGDFEHSIEDCVNNPDLEQAKKNFRNHIERLRATKTPPNNTGPITEPRDRLVRGMRMSTP